MDKVQSLLDVWTKQEKTIRTLTKIPKGYRDLMWCPYLNEPAILEYKDGEPNCPNCHGNFEPETHAFIGHVSKPRWKKK